LDVRGVSDGNSTQVRGGQVVISFPEVGTGQDKTPAEVTTTAEVPRTAGVATASRVPTTTAPDTPGEELIDLAKRGDRDAFAHLYEQHVRGVYRYVYYRVGTRHLAEDITSETFCRALRSLGNYRGTDATLGAWLVTIARNLVTDYFKCGARRHEVAVDDPQPGPSLAPTPEEAAISSLTSDSLIRSLDDLTEAQRDCLILRFIQGMSVAETADILRRSEGSVKQLQWRAIRRLAMVISEEMR
jgi:RNA polymerase sigma-70 factor, ECF subfamily